MPVSFGGVAILPPPGQAFTDFGFWHGSEIRQTELPGFFPPANVDHLPIPDQPHTRAPRIGVLHWPTGASRWATFHAVATGEQKAAIEALGSTPAARELVLFDGVRTIRVDMWMLPPYPIAQKGAGELYLLTFVDERYYWWQEGTQSAPTSAPASWSALLTSLFSSVGVTPTLPTISSNYGTPSPIRWTVGYKPLPLLIDAAAHSCGLRVLRYLDGTVECQNQADAATADDTRWTSIQYDVLMGGRLSVDAVARYVPASVGVVFWGYEPDLQTKTLTGLSLTEYGSAAGVSGRAGLIVADLPAVSGSTPKSNYATQAATDYYLWALSRTDATLRGLFDLDVTGLDAALELVHEPHQLVTRILRAPLADRNLYGDTPPEIRFPVELTGPYNASTGYPWKRLTLDTATQSYISAVPAKTGTGLFEVGGNATLDAPTRALAYSNPDGDGWEFQAPTEGVNPGGCDATGWGWVSGLLETECLFLTVLSGMGLCDDINTAQQLYLRWDVADQKWVTKEWDPIGLDWVDADFVTAFDSSPIFFWIDAGRPRLQISGITYDLVLVCGGAGVLVFAGGTDAVCNGTAPILPGGACADNTFLLQIECTCCPIDGWDGPGWYCIDDGDGCPGVAAELTDDDKCDSGLTICSGPYATQEDAEADCPPPPFPITLSCNAGTMDISSQISVTAQNNPITGVTGSGTATLFYDAGLGDATTWIWEGSGSFSNGNETGGACGPVTIKFQYRVRCIDDSPDYFAADWRCSCDDGTTWRDWIEGPSSPFLPFTLEDPGFSITSCGNPILPCPDDCSAIYWTFAEVV